MILREWFARLVAMFRKRQLQDRLDDELALHRDLLAEDLAAAGSTSTVARELGGSSFRDAYDDRAGFPWIDHLWRDTRYALRAMRRAPTFSLIVIATLALGIGVTTAIFSVVHGILLKPLPYPSAERLVWLGEATGRSAGISISWPNYVHWRTDNRSFETMSAILYGGLTMTGRGDAQMTRAMYVTAEYFPMLGMRPLLGRLFGASDDRPGAAPTIVLSHAFWNTLGGDPALVGATLTLDGQAYEVIGVAAPLWQVRPVDVYLPVGRRLGAIVDRGRHDSMRAIARLKPDVTLEAARRDLDGIMERLAERDPGPEDGHRSYVTLLTQQTVGGSLRGTLLVLMGAATLVLLVACANVASLLLARGTTRVSEFAVRTAIGAGRGRLVRQLLTEHLVLAAIGGGAGVLLADRTRALLVAFGPPGTPRLAETTIDLPVLAFACVITLATGLIAGLAPVIAAGRLDLATALKEGARAGSDKRRHYARGALVIAEVALTFVLVFGSGLLLRSLAAAQQAESGVDAARLLSLQIALPSSSYKGGEAIAAFQTRLAADLRALPGVTDLGIVHCPPGTGGCSDWFFSVPGRAQPARNEVPISLFNAVDPDYFRTARVPIRQGRAFTIHDRATSPRVAIVNETFARRWWPDASPIGQQIKVGGPYIDGPLLEVVGVVADVKQGGLDAEPMLEIYQPLAQRPEGAMAVMIRTAGDPDAIAPAVRRVVAAIDRNLPILRLMPLERAFGERLTSRRFITALLTSFAALAVVLAVIGIYGLLSYWVNIRQREIAIRLALGARPALIMRWTSLQALRLALIGITIGVFAGWVAARGLDDLVFGIPARNPATILAAAVAVAGVALLAAAIPALRAARVDAAGHLHQS